MAGSLARHGRENAFGELRILVMSAAVKGTAARTDPIVPVVMVVAATGPMLGVAGGAVCLLCSISGCSRACHGKKA